MKPFDEHGAFCAGDDQYSLRRTAVRGAGLTVLSQNAGFALQVIATVVLARLLTPADVGLVAMVTTFSLLWMNFGFNGFTEAVVQAERIDHALASNLFWINLGLGLLLTIIFAAAGSLLASFYGDPRVAAVAVAMSATIVLTSVSVLHLALLKRAFCFPVLSANDVAARAISVAVSIALAWAGWGYWALVGGAIALPLTTSAGAWLRCRWIPGAPRRRGGTAALVRFAMNTYGHFAANYVTRNLDNFLVGWFFGPQALGFYKKAYDLGVLPVAQFSDPLHAVAVPVLSRVAGDLSVYRRCVMRGLSTLAFLGMGLGAALALIGKDLILILLGPQWGESATIFSFFAPGIGAMLLYLAYGWIHLSLGRPDRLFRWAIVEFTVIGLLFVTGLRWGPSGIALAWVVSVWTLAIPALWYAGRPAGLGGGAIAGAVWKFAASAAIAASLCAAIVPLIPSLAAASGLGGAIHRSVTTSLLFTTLYLTGVAVFHRGFTPLAEIAELVGEMLPRRFSRTVPVPAAPAVIERSTVA